MPTYEYLCNECGNKFEHFEKNFRENTAHCPTCKTTNIKKCLSLFQIDPDGVYLMNEKQKREYWSEPKK